eukprot:6182967-Pleurochrysis_carterae.AAC.3
MGHPKQANGRMWGVRSKHKDRQHQRHNTLGQPLQRRGARSLKRSKWRSAASTNAARRCRFPLRFVIHVQMRDIFVCQLAVQLQSGKQTFFVIAVAETVVTNTAWMSESVSNLVYDACESQGHRTASAQGRRLRERTLLTSKRLGPKVTRVTFRHM